MHLLWVMGRGTCVWGEHESSHAHKRLLAHFANNKLCLSAQQFFWLLELQWKDLKALKSNFLNWPLTMSYGGPTFFVRIVMELFYLFLRFLSELLPLCSPHSVVSAWEKGRPDFAEWLLSRPTFCSGSGSGSGLLSVMTSQTVIGWGRCCPRNLKQSVELGTTATWQNKNVQEKSRQHLNLTRELFS